jgi:hypothetical protein
VPDHVLLDEVLEEALVQVVHDRRGERQQLGREALHLLGHLEAGHAVADQRLVHVEVEELDLGVGDRGQRLAVDPDELEEGDEREARGEHGGDVAQELDVVVGDRVQPRWREPERRPDALDQRRLEPGVGRHVVERARVGLGREQLLHVAVGEAARSRCVADLVERVAAIAQTRHDACVGDRRRRPRAGRQRDDPLAHPAAERAGRDVDPARDLAHRDVAHDRSEDTAEHESGGTAVVAPPPAGNAARCLGRRRSSGGRRLAGCHMGQPHFPAYCLGRSVC